MQRSRGGTVASPGGAGGTGAVAGEKQAAGDHPPAADGPAAELRARALGDSVVKAMLELFPAEITAVEKI